MDSQNQQLKIIFEKAYAGNNDALYRFVLFRVSDKEETIDLVEETFVKFWQTLLKEEVSEPRALLYKIARNLVIDWYRKKKSLTIQTFPEEGERKHIFLDMFEGDIVGAEVSLEAKLIIEKMLTLEAPYREAVYLRFVEELTPKEIAEILGESANTVSVRINRGMNMLKSKIHI